MIEVHHESNDAAYMRQAMANADEHLRVTIDRIDARFGEGFAMAHPELIAAFMQTSAIDMAASAIARSIERQGSNNT
jgi:hypothetical protein